MRIHVVLTTLGNPLATHRGMTRVEYYVCRCAWVCVCVPVGVCNVCVMSSFCSHGHGGSIELCDGWIMDKCRLKPIE